MYRLTGISFNFYIAILLTVELTVTTIMDFNKESVEAYINQFNDDDKLKVLLIVFSQQSKPANTSLVLALNDYCSNSSIELAIDKVVINDSYDNYKEAYDHMDKQGVTHLGWLNAGIQVPSHLNCEKVYSNRSGSSCLYCDPVYRISYSVDMGD